jgi:hypothetical protein
VYIAVRSEEKARAAIQDLKSETGKEAEFLRVDLADLPSIKRAAEEFTRYVDFEVHVFWFRPYDMDRKETQLHVLFNNGYVLRFAAVRC